MDLLQEFPFFCRIMETERGVVKDIAVLKNEIAMMTSREKDREDKIAVLEKQIQVLSSIEKDTAQNVSSEADKTETAVMKPDDLKNVILQQQKKYIGPTGMTDDELKKFINDRIAEKISNELLSDIGFINIVISIKELTDEEKNNLLTACEKIERLTVAQAGENAGGITEAGQKAERMIAEEIVKTARLLLTKPVEEIKK